MDLAVGLLELMGSTGSACLGTVRLGSMRVPCPVEMPCWELLKPVELDCSGPMV